MGKHSDPKNSSDEWYTPTCYIDSAKEVMGCIDVDPASNKYAQQYIQAKKYYTVDDSSLVGDVSWIGKVWMNPPYSRVIKEFASKLKEQVLMGNTTEAIVLTNNGTDTQWCHDLLSISTAICLHKGRIQFISNTSNSLANTKGQIIYYIGDNPDKFSEVFSKYGIIFKGE